MQTGNWIWENRSSRKDEYVRFIDHFRSLDGTVYLSISCDSNYTVWVNNALTSFGQYPDYPDYKVYDFIDITSYCHTGENKIEILVWYYGEDTQTYFLGKAGVIYEITNQGNVLAFSSDKTMCQIASEYRNNYCKFITKQLGFAFLYDAREENSRDFKKSVFVDGITKCLTVNPVKKLLLKERCKSLLIKEIRKNTYLYDLGAERVGFLDLEVVAKKGAKLLIAYGEHIVDGTVRRIIDDRDFSVEYICKEGHQKYLNTFRRLGCRYLEIEASEEIEIKYVGIRNTDYDIQFKPFKAENDLRQRIYEICLNSLKLCMHEHYEDCPWREQALYTMDSRNQMLCGYYSIEGGNYDYARANLKLISKGVREDGLLSLCFPGGRDLPIPFFTLVYFIQMEEYITFSKDISLVRELFPLLAGIMELFVNRINQNGLVSRFEEPFWNFYEWNEGQSDCDEKDKEPDRYELQLNAAFSLALQSLSRICSKMGTTNNYLEIARRLNEAIYRNFYNQEKKAFVSFINSKNDSHYSELSNSLALLCGAAFNEEERICELLTGESELIKTTLSMNIFKYDALIMVNKSKYKDYILTEIDDAYSKMLDSGADTVWETILGEKDFNNAGSLCHGWSALPIYIYNKYNLNKRS